MPFYKKIEQIQLWLSKHALTYFGFIVFLFIILVPFYWIFLSSITPRHQLFQIPPLYFPYHSTLGNYKNLLQNIPFFWYFFNSLVFAVGSSGFSVFVSFLAAYAFARISFPGRNVLLFFFLISIALPQIVTIVPLYEVFNYFRLTNTLYGLIIIMSSLVTPFTIWVLVSFIKQIPPEIDEAATIDGANLFKILWKVILPIVKPAIGTMIIINFITAWSELLYPLVFAVDKSSKTLTVGLTEVAIESTSYAKPWDLISALSIIMIIPVVLLVLLFQRTIISGLTRGAIK